MDISLITDLSGEFPGWGRLYQAAAPDNGITTFQSPGRHTMLIEMAAGIDALPWVRQNTIKAVLYFGIDDSPDACLDDKVLHALARSGRAWLSAGGDVISGCGAGVSRSSYASCAMLMLIHGCAFDQAIEIVRKGRPQANPNSGFVTQLRRLNLLTGEKP